MNLILKLIYPFSSREKNDGKLYRFYMVVYPIIFIISSLMLYVDIYDSRIGWCYTSAYFFHGKARERLDDRLDKKLIDFDRWETERQQQQKDIETKEQECSEMERIHLPDTILMWFSISIGLHIILNFIIFKIILGFIISGNSPKITGNEK